MDIIIIDGKNACYRAGFTRTKLHSSSGKPTGAIFGILSTIIRLKKYYPFAKFVFCWDGAETNRSWRHKISKEYKANRKRPNDPTLSNDVVHILSQIPAVKKIIDILGIEQYESRYVEADDLIGILSKRYKKQKGIENIYIYSMDKDFFQLIDDKVSVVRDLDKAKKCKAYKAKDVFKDYGVYPKDWVRYRSLIGDPSDGIKPPIKKVGKVRALKLLAAGLDPSKPEPTIKIEKQYKDAWQKIHLNYKLSKILRDANNPKLTNITLDANSVLVNKKVLVKKFVAFCSEYELDWILEQRHIFYNL